MQGMLILPQDGMLRGFPAGLWQALIKSWALWRGRSKLMLYQWESRCWVVSGFKLSEYLRMPKSVGISDLECRFRACHFTGHLVFSCEKYICSVRVQLWEEVYLLRPCSVVRSIFAVFGGSTTFIVIHLLLSKITELVLCCLERYVVSGWLCC